MSGARERARRGPGAGRVVLLGVVVAAVLGGTFAVGLYMGRQSRPAPAAEVEPPKRAPAPRRSGLVEPVAERSSDSREPLTFYQTLTAPLAPLPVPQRVSAGAKPSVPEPAAARPGPDPRAAAPAAPAWTVQVGVFRDRRQAEGLKQKLAEGGVEAHLADAHGDDGQPRHRVRVGSFKTRDEAARVAARIAAERRVPTYVTVR